MARVRKTTPKPVVHDETPKPVVHDETPKPVVHDETPKPVVHDETPKPIPRAKVGLRSAEKLTRRGSIYYKSRPFVVEGEENIQAWENDGLFTVTRLISSVQL